ncbi:hypothetical protein F5B17DRAFT_177879 [Nemania serpens]|nr:hypothetical protein F5B17DRAFT_177879 [Nemania serpens]
MPEFVASIIYFASLILVPSPWRPAKSFTMACINSTGTAPREMSDASFETVMAHWMSDLFLLPITLMQPLLQ